jgi:hypothetical protein
MDTVLDLAPSRQPAAVVSRARITIEQGAGLAATIFVGALLFLTTINAGPLWRDEVNSINMAQMSSLKEFWSNMPFESFPALWLMVLRVWSFLGMASSDAGIRVLGLFIGTGFLGCLWLCTKWTGARAPMLSLTLLGTLPAFIFSAASNRAYGLALCLLVLSFATLWRFLERPSASRLLWAGISGLLFLHCVYYDTVFFGAMLFGAALVLARRRDWRNLTGLAAVGAVTGLSMAIYLPVIHRGAPFLPLIHTRFNLARLWGKLCHAVSAQSSAHSVSANGPEIWFWLLLVALAIVVALWLQVRASRAADNSGKLETAPARLNADLALFSVATLVSGTVGCMWFLLRLRFPTETWYYIELLALAGITFDAILSAPWPGLRPWGWLRIGFLALMLTWGGRAVWAEAHTRRSNIDLIAGVLEHQAAPGDFIVVQAAWEGVTFDRYYHGPARWVTVPPIDSHKVHRSDLVWTQLNSPHPMAPVLAETVATLQQSNSVWIVGPLVINHPNQLPESIPPPPNLPTKWWLGIYLWYWSAELAAQVFKSAEQMRNFEIRVDAPVSSYERLTLTQFRGYRRDAVDGATVPVH